nr:hypothetical protein JVH1_9067 [Rhodococcus sp. JVH1]
MTTLDDRRTSHVGTHLRTRRERRRLSQLELANRADISAATSASWRPGGRIPPGRCCCGSASISTFPCINYPVLKDAGLLLTF